MGNTVNDKFFLKEVNLSGYKSIENVNIEFQKGLNIIIGKNAAGKTNFLKFLSKMLLFEYTELNNFKSLLKFKNGKDISLETNRNIDIKDLLNDSILHSKIDSTLVISNKVIKDKKGEETSISQKLAKNSILLHSSFICHGIPKDYILIDKPFSFKMDNKNRLSSELFALLRDKSLSYFTKCITIDMILLGLDKVRLNENLTIDNIRESFGKIFRVMENLKFALQKYSPIEDIRFTDNYNIFISEGNESFELNNLFLEFKIAGDWLPFSSLSDGTKRLFFIISEIFEIDENENVKPTNLGNYYNASEISRIILIEEPELGIHPHQFHKLMEFLKDQSEKMQIIITTHSPQALDSVNQDELSRIVIAYNSDEGTKLRHLNENELIKANEYIKEDFLSDYWLYSDLEQ